MPSLFRWANMSFGIIAQHKQILCELVRDTPHCLLDWSYWKIKFFWEQHDHAHAERAGHSHEALPSAQNQGTRRDPVSDSSESNEETWQRGVCLCELCSRPMGAPTGPFTDLGVGWKAGSAGLPSPVSGRQPGNQKTQRLRPHLEVRAVLCQCQWSGWGPCPPGRAPGGSALPAGEPAHRPEAALLGSGHELHSRYRHQAGGWLQTDTERESGTAWANPPPIFGFK